MKPPPRARNKVVRNVQPEPRPRRSCPWTRTEQTKLRDALKRLSRTAGDGKELDYAVLGEAVPTRSVSQLRSVVDSLKNQVISRANLKLKRMKCEERRARKPIQEWTHLASVMAGTREEAITTALSQMFIVSSTEPRTLRNCDPPQVHRPPSDKDRLAGHTRPSRRVPRSPSPAECPDTRTAHARLFRTPAPTRAPAVTMANSTVTPPKRQAQVPVGPTTALQPASKTVTPVTTQVPPITDIQSVCTPGTPTTQKHSEQHPSIIPMPTSPSPHTPAAACPPPIPGSAPSSGPAGSTQPTLPKTTSTAEPHASKHTAKDAAKVCDVQTAVDFERIYRYLSAAHKPNEERRLTPMESAILLDLLMSLPEELVLLDCPKLQSHLIQVFGCLTSHGNSDAARAMCKDLKERLCTPIGATKGQDGPRSAAPQSAAPQSAAGTQPDEAESQSSGIDGPSSQSADPDVMGLWPPLNPFLIPLKLLQRKQVGGQSSKTNVHQF